MIVAAMATMPERLPYLEDAVNALRPQVDALRVYLNNFKEIPPFLSAEEAYLSSEALGDLGDAGKFYWVSNGSGLDYSHYLTVDDDLGYPDDYVATLMEEFDARKQKAVVGVHGSTFVQPIEDFVTSREARYRFYEKLDRAQVVHILGTATTILSRQTLGLSLDDFRMRNAADLQLAIAAQRQNVPMVAIPRPEGWISEERPWTAEGYSIWKTTKEPGRSVTQTNLARTAIAHWNLFDDPISLNGHKAVHPGARYPETRPRGSFDTCVESLSSKLGSKLFFVEVGAMDGINHDSLHKHIVKNEGWEGLLVEPLPDMFAKLKANYNGRANLHFENSAITNQVGQAEITRIPTENVGREAPAWADGISTLRPDIHIIGSQADLKPYSVTEPVKTTRFETLVTKYGVTEIDILQIDAEGYDKDIFNQVWEANFRPSIIKLEINYLSAEEVHELSRFLEANGYQCFIERFDIVAVKV